MKNFLIPLALLVSVHCISQQSDSIKDPRDGEIYKVVKIGQQWWMAENLRATAYPDGTTIPEVENNTDWDNLSVSDKAYCYYNNDSVSYADNYGALYTWAAAMNGKPTSNENPSGVQGACPVGWHLPSDAEWTALEDFINTDGHDGTEGTALKSKTGWASEGNGTDHYGFAALPGGSRFSNVSFYNEGTYGYWWSSTTNGTNYASSRYLSYKYSDVIRDRSGKETGFSVRCLRDSARFAFLAITDSLLQTTDSVAFGQANLNQASVTRSFYISNTSTTDNIQLTGLSTSTTDLQNDLALPHTLAPGEKVAFTLTFHGTEQGLYRDSLTLVSNDPYKDTLVTPITAQAITRDSITDPRDGEIYKVVKIGQQWWMAENLRANKYPDGTLIPKVEDNTAWGNLGDTSEAYCYYDNDSVLHYETYGTLYTWAAAMKGKSISDGNPSGVQGACPVGWHLPSDAEWTELEDFISTDGHDGTEGTALKATAGWGDDGNGTDDYGFAAIPGGYRSGSNGTFSYGGYSGYWWSATEYSTADAYRQGLSYGNSDVSRGYLDKEYGFSVRCLRNIDLFGYLAVSDTMNREIETIVFDDTKPSNSREVTINIYNTGGTAVQVNNLSVNSGAYQLSSAGGTISAGDALPLTITFSPAAKGEYFDTLLIESNDPYKPVIRIPIEGFSATTTCGVIASDQTWTKDNSPYFITCGSFGIDVGVTLTIEKGVSVYLDSARMFMVDGTLQVNGTKGEPVKFDGLFNHSFDKIHFRPGAIGNLNHMHISDANTAIYFEGNELRGNGLIVKNCNKGINAGAGSVLLDSCLVQDISSTGIGVNCDEYAITNSEIAYNQAGIVVRGNGRLENNTIHHNGSNGLDMVGGMAIDNEVYDNDGIGINAEQECRIYANRIKNNASNGIDASGCFIEDNNIAANQGIGIGGSDNEIRSNIVIQNQQDGIYSSQESIISFNKITSNTGNGIRMEGRNEVRSNKIANNTLNGIKDNASSENSIIQSNDVVSNGANGITTASLPVVKENNIHDNFLYDLEAQKQTNDTIKAYNNCWGTADSTVIAANIYDYYDDVVTVKVLFTGYKSSAYTPGKVKKFRADGFQGGKITLTWGNHPHAYQYYLYHDNGQGILDTLSTWAVLDSTKTSYTASLPDGNYIFGIRAVSYEGVNSKMAMTTDKVDGSAPVILSAYGNTQDTLLYVTFSEDIDFHSLKNVSNWGIDNGLSVIDISKAEMKDLFYGNPKSRPVYHFENVGRPTKPEWELESTSYNNMDGRYVLNFADIDADGDKDMFAGEYSPTLTIYRNTGNKYLASWAEETVINLNSYFNKVRLIDIDNDNDLDLFANGVWLENLGSRKQPVWSESKDFFEGKHAICDIDHDGDCDLFSQKDGKLKFYRNIGDKTEPIWKLEESDYLNGSPFNENYSYPDLVDIDNDGDFDLFMSSNRDSSNWQNSTSFYENTGSPFLPEFTLITEAYGPDITHGRPQPTFVDIDGDGRGPNTVMLVLDNVLPGINTPLELTYNSARDEYGNESSGESLTFYTDDGNKNPVVVIDDISGEVEADIPINYTIMDEEGDAVDLYPRYSKDGGDSWLVPSISGDTTQIDSNHYRGTLTWHSYSDLPNGEFANVLFKLTPRDDDIRNHGTPALTNRLYVDNNLSPELSIDPITGEVNDTVDITYSVNDAEGDPIAITAEYYDEATKYWYPAHLVGDTAGLSSGNHTIRWASKTDLPTAAQSIKFRITPYDDEKGTADTIQLVLDNIGISSVQITNEGSLPYETGGDITIEYLISDDENDVIDLNVEYSRNGGSTWQTPSITGNLTGITSANYTGSFTWHTATDFTDVDYDNVVLKITPNDGNDGILAEQNFHIDNNVKPTAVLPAIPGINRGDITIPYTLDDTEGNILGVKLQYYNEGTWKDATIYEAGKEILPAYYSGQLVWNSEYDLPEADGDIKVKVIPYDKDDGEWDTTTVHVNNFPVIELGNSSEICDGQTDTLDMGCCFQSITWSDGTPTQKNVISTEGDYAAVAVDHNGKHHYSDTFHLTVHDLPLISLGNDTSFCYDETHTLDAGSFTSYLWNDSSAQSTLTVDTTGDYSVRVTDFRGCSNSDTIHVHTQVAYEEEEISFVTVDTSDHDNVIVWDKTGGKGTALYHIYRESTVGGYEKIATIPYAEQPVFVDTSSYAEQLSYRYKITTEDSCGHESGLSAYHNNIQLKVNKGSEGYDLEWESYDGFNINSYDIYRGSSPDDMEKIYEVAGSITKYSDVVVPPCAVYYQIKADIPAGNNTYGYSRIVSNISSNGAVPAEPVIRGPQEICFGNTATLDAGNFESYNWSNGSNSQTIQPKVSGEYSVIVTNSFGCVGESEPFKLTVYPGPDYDLGKDTALCGDQSFTIEGPEDYVAYSWDNGSVQRTRTVSTDGLYGLTVTDTNGCSSSDEIMVTYHDLPAIDLNAMEYMCPNDSLFLDPGSFNSYLWQDGSKSRIHTVTKPGNYQVAVTDIHHCKSSAEVKVSHYETPLISLGPDASICQNEDFTIQPDGSFASYQWSTEHVTPDITVNEAGDYWLSAVDNNGCQRQSDTMQLTVHTIPQFNLGNDTVICGTNAFTYSGPAGFNAYLWNDSAATRDITINYPGGEYLLEVEDTNGCSSTDKLNIRYKTLPVINLNPVEYKCGNTDLNLDPGEYKSYEWSDGSSSRILTVEEAGNYKVTVTDFDNCQNAKEIKVESRGAPSINLGEDKTACLGDSVELSTMENFVSYLWSNGKTNETITVDKSGRYSVTATDVFKCESSDTINVTFNPTPDKPLLGDDRIVCHGETIALDAGENYAAYAWSTGDSSQTIEIDTTGQYSLEVLNEFECKNADTVNIITQIPGQQKICMVTVGAAGNNIIAWEREEASGIVEYKIYKESSAADDYFLIGTREHDALSVFVDTNSTPAKRSERYKISAVDTCGNESVLSQEHKTMHLTVNEGIDGQYNLIWENYEGIDFDSYIVYRGASPDNLSQIDVVPSNITTYTDLPPEGQQYYQIGLILPGTCYPARLKSTANGPYSQSVSNMEKKLKSGTGIFSSNHIEAMEFYPNPASDALHFILHENFEMLEIVDSKGQSVLQTEIVSSEFTIDIHNLHEGFYIIKLYGEENYAIGKIIKE